MKKTALLSAFVVAIGMNTAHAKVDSDISLVIETLSKYKAEAEQDASVAARACVPRDRCGFRFTYYNMFYNRARKSFDDLIHSVVKQIRRSRDLDDSALVQHMIKEAAKQYGVMKHTFEKMKARDIDGVTTQVSYDMSEAIRASVIEITGSSRKIQSKYERSGSHKRQTLISVLNGLKWRRFGEIRRDRSSVVRTPEEMRRASGKQGGSG